MKFNCSCSLAFVSYLLSGVLNQLTNTLLILLELRSFRPTNKQCIQLQRLSCCSILLISFSNVCRYLLTVLSKQQLIQPLGY